MCAWRKYLPGGGYRGDLPEGWTKSLTHEVALALAMPAVSADRLMWLAWDLQARLPGVGELLAPLADPVRPQLHARPQAVPSLTERPEPDWGHAMGRGPRASAGAPPALQGCPG